MAACLEETSCKLIQSHVFFSKKLFIFYQVLKTNHFSAVLCQSSTAAGPGPPDESVAQEKDEATAENNATSNRSSGYMSCIQRNKEGTEKGNDAQVSLVSLHFILSIIS